MAAGFLMGCQNSDGVSITASSSFSFGSALAQFFVADFTPYETAAAALRNADARYTVQDFIWSFTGSSEVYESYSIANANVEYAHAAGLTGAGQIISVIDSGFLVSHDEFAGKTISAAGGVGALGVDDHGTAVASVAAGASGSGEIIGVAPGADLQLGTFDSFATMTAGTIQARSLGAIVQNNSWGYAAGVSTTNYTGLFGGSSGRAYIDALTSLAEDAVIVFAASNSIGAASQDIMAALPVLLPDLEPSWIAAVNAVPDVVSEEIMSATLVSSGCLEAAAWCIAADGTAYAATDTGDSDYEIGSGTSFSAPIVSGAIALLAEAFPTLNAQELRARLLASADNSFFEQTGFVDFGGGVEHGFNESLGHGFVDVKAALLPIGGSYVPTGSGRIDLGDPVIVSGGMAGNALSARLAPYDIVVLDGLGTDFSAPANILAAEAVPQSDPVLASNTLLGVDLDAASANPFQKNSVFSQYVTGGDFELNLGDMQLALLLPTDDSGDPSFGLSVSREMDLGRSTLQLGLSVMHEGSGFVGMQAVSSTGTLASDHAAARVDWTMPLAGNSDFGISGTLGIAEASGSLAAMSMNSVGYNAISMNYGRRNVFGDGDRLAFGLRLPEAVTAGSATVVTPVAMSATGVSYETLDISLSPQARQLDLTIGYGKPLAEGVDFLVSATRSLNHGNIAGRDNSIASFGIRVSF